MQWFIVIAKNLGVSDALITRWGVDDPVTFIEDIEWFYEGIRKSVFKRTGSLFDVNLLHMDLIWKVSYPCGRVIITKDVKPVLNFENNIIATSK